MSDPNCFADYWHLHGKGFGPDVERLAWWFYRRAAIDTKNAILEDLKESIDFNEEILARPESQVRR